MMPVTGMGTVPRHIAQSATLDIRLVRYLVNWVLFTCARVEISFIHGIDCLSEVNFL